MVQWPNGFLTEVEQQWGECVVQWPNGFLTEVEQHSGRVCGSVANGFTAEVAQHSGNNFFAPPSPIAFNRFYSQAIK